MSLPKGLGPRGTGKFLMAAFSRRSQGGPAGHSKTGTLIGTAYGISSVFLALNGSRWGCIVGFDHYLTKDLFFP